MASIKLITLVAEWILWHHCVNIAIAT